MPPGRAVNSVQPCVRVCNKAHPACQVLLCCFCYEFCYIKAAKAKLLKAKIAVALHDELGRVPKKEEIEQVFLLKRVMYKAVLGLHFKRKEQKQTGQLPIF